MEYDLNHSKQLSNNCVYRVLHLACTENGVSQLHETNSYRNCIKST